MAASGLYRVYIGNLGENVQDETLERLFQEHDLSPFNILVKRGYAFVDLPDHSSFDRAIETLNGMYIFSCFIILLSMLFLTTKYFAFLVF